jgi:hypothetical protein
MDLLGFGIPLWAIFLIVIVFVIIAWSLIKFAIKVFLIILGFFIILVGLDFFGFFDMISNLLSNFI